MHRILVSCFVIFLTAGQLNFITGKLIGEGARMKEDALTQLTCTVKNRLLNKWNKNAVMNHYYAPFVKPTKEEVEKVEEILTTEYDCGEVYFAYSDSDVRNLRIKQKPLVQVCDKKRCLNFFEKWFRRR